MLIKYPQGAVEIYIVAEVLIDRRWKAAGKIESAQANDTVSTLASGKARP